MSRLSIAEENYLKAIYKIIQIKGLPSVNTNKLAEEIGTSAASVTDMIQRLADKSMVLYQKYRGASLTKEGQQVAIQLLRKHRLWEAFLVDSLGFRWDEVHDLAEQLEHIQSEELIDRLDAFLGYPRFDPHGDPIPNEQGNFMLRQQVSLATLEPSSKPLTMLGVRQHKPEFLRYLDELKLIPGTQLTVLDKNCFAKTMHIALDSNESTWITQETAMDIYVKPN